MNKFALNFFISSIFFGCCSMQVTTLPINFYNKQASKLVNKFDFSNEKLKKPTVFFLAQRVHQGGKAIEIQKNEVKIIDNAFFSLEVQYLNVDLIGSMLKRYASVENCNGLFMLEFAKAVESNVLHALRDTIGFYFGNDLDAFEQGLGLQKVTIEEFNVKIKQVYSPEELMILSVLEGRKFASIVLELLTL